MINWINDSPANRNLIDFQMGHKDFQKYFDSFKRSLSVIDTFNLR